MWTVSFLQRGLSCRYWGSCRNNCVPMVLLSLPLFSPSGHGPSIVLSSRYHCLPETLSKRTLLTRVTARLLSGSASILQAPCLSALQGAFPLSRQISAHPPRQGSQAVLDLDQADQQTNIYRPLPGVLGLKPCSATPTHSSFLNLMPLLVVRPDLRASIGQDCVFSASRGSSCRCCCLNYCIAGPPGAGLPLQLPWRLRKRMQSVRPI